MYCYGGILLWKPEVGFGRYDHRFALTADAFCGSSPRVSVVGENYVALVSGRSCRYLRSRVALAKRTRIFRHALFFRIAAMRTLLSRNRDCIVWVLFGRAPAAACRPAVALWRWYARYHFIMVTLAFAQMAVLRVSPTKVAVVATGSICTFVRRSRLAA